MELEGLARHDSGDLDFMFLLLLIQISLYQRACSFKVGFKTNERGLTDSPLKLAHSESRQGDGLVASISS